MTAAERAAEVITVAARPYGTRNQSPVAVVAALMADPDLLREMADEADPQEPIDGADLLYQAWCVIANVSEGDWGMQSDEWREAAYRWRDAWHKTLPSRREAAIVTKTGRVMSDAEIALFDQVPVFDAIAPSGRIPVTRSVIDDLTFNPPAPQNLDVARRRGGDRDRAREAWDRARRSARAPTGVEPRSLGNMDSAEPCRAPGASVMPRPEPVVGGLGVEARHAARRTGAGRRAFPFIDPVPWYTAAARVAREARTRITEAAWILVHGLEDDDR